MSVKEVSQITYNFGFVILAAVAGYVGWHEYKSAQTEQKIGRSMVVWERFYRSPVSDSWKIVSASVLKHDGKILDILKNSTVGNIDKNYRDVVISIIVKDEIEHDVHVILDFFDESIFCVESGLCDRTAIEKPFKHKMKKFRNFFRPYFIELGTSYNSSIDGNLKRFIQH
ncbi:hypothetical protein [Pelagibius sp. Alg239-R121]|uniref:hypothetical protein n=1 Tax=Pelagibius sp. Alg239-R121 TaxID=2993448 RepID=UPI0024A702CC|nr:hypothetical protein [Pelagibius sp. Alg239-R121]